MKTYFTVMLIAAAICFGVVVWSVQRCELVGTPPNYCFGDKVK